MSSKFSAGAFPQKRAVVHKMTPRNRLDRAILACNWQTPLCADDIRFQLLDRGIAVSGHRIGQRLKSLKLEGFVRAGLRARNGCAVEWELRS